MKTILITLALFSCVNFASAQWISLGEGGWDIDFINANTGWYVGDAGLIKKSTNGGLNWVTLEPWITNTRSRGIEMIDGNTGFVCLEANPPISGQILKTTTGGAATGQWVAGGPSFYDMDFYNSSFGIAVGEGRFVIKTTDGGSMWSGFLLPALYGDLYAVRIVSPSVVFIGSAGGGIVRSNDGGNSFTNVYLTTTNPVVSIFFTDIQTGYAVLSGGAGNILKTTNGGTNWTISSTGGTNLHEIYFVNSQTGYLCGANGRMMVTTNAGLNWTNQPTGTTFELRHMDFVNETTGWAIGHNGIIKTTTGGFSPPSAPALTTPANNSIGQSITPLMDWDSASTATSYRLHIATDSMFIISVYDTTIQSSNLSLRDGILLDGTKYYWRVRGSNNIGTGAWSIVWNFRTGLRPFPPNQVSPANNSTGLIVTPLLDWDSVNTAANYRVQVSTDSLFGTSSLDTTLAPSAVTVPAGRLSLNTKYFWRVRASNSVGSSGWSEAWNFRTGQIPSAPGLIAPANNSTGQLITPLLDWDSTSSVTQFRVQVSTDSAFGTANFDTTLNRSSVTVPAGRLSHFTKYYWRVMATNSFGSSPWSTPWNFTTEPMTGVINTAGEIPKEYKLYNNYPNPFNPVTKIKFDIPNASHVKVIVYDMLGKVVATLIDKQLNAGKYEAEFNGSAVPTGVYFYRVEAGDYRQVMKMVLAK